MKRTLISMALAIAGWTVFPASAATVKLNSPVDCNIFGISENGEWAVGAQGNSISEVYAFRWNLITNEIELTDSPAECGNSISNDGTYCGGFSYTDERGKTFMAPGYYDGQWHVLPLPEGTITDAFDGAISPDGRHMAITVQIDGKYRVVQYEDKKFVRILHSDDDHSRVYAISNDGRYVGGWTYAHIPGVSVNRTGVYWEGDSEYKIIDAVDDITKCHRSPWAGVKRFTSDGKHALYYGGWVNKKGDDPAHVVGVKNLETGDVMSIYPPDDRGSECMANDMADDLTLVGHYAGEAAIFINGQAQYFVDWLLNEKGIDARKDWTEVMTYNGAFLLESAICIQPNKKTIGLRYNGSDQEVHSMVIRFDVDLTNAAPATVRLSKVEKLNTILVKWLLPYGIDMSTVKGFNIYRNGEKINATPLSGDHYYDTNLETDKTYNYEVTAVYEEGESVKSKTVSLDLASDKPEAPTTLLSRQRGLNSVALSWSEPLTNLVQKNYFAQNSLTEGFGVSEVGTTAEFGVKFDAEEMALYGNAKISAVEFYPMSEQSNWKVALYTEDADGTVTKLASYDVTQELKLRERNIFQFPQTLEIPQGKNVIAAVSVTCSDASTSINMMGIQFDTATQGYSDLLRRVMEPEEEFQSLATMAQASGMTMYLSWKISLVLTPEGASTDLDTVEKYVVSRDGVEIATTSDKTCNDQFLADGTYTYGIKAVYADGRISPEATIQQTVAARTELCVPAENVKVAVNESTLDVTWEAPVDNDITDVTYARGNRDPKTMITAGNNNYNLQAASIYPTTMFTGLDGYNIIGAKFYPTAEATYTIILDRGVGTRELVYHEVDEYTKDQWNTVLFDEPIKLAANTTYRLIVDCYDVEYKGSPLAVDDTEGQTGYTCLINVTSGSDVWQEVSASTGKSNNWMMGLILTDSNGHPLPIKGYDVVMDGQKLNNGLVSDTSYSHPTANLNAQASAQHSLTVETWYEPLATAVASEAVTFTLDGSSIDETFVADITINRNGTMINVTGGVTGIAIYDMNGVMVASVEGDTISVDSLATGIYVLKAATADKEVVTKINIRK